MSNVVRNQSVTPYLGHPPLILHLRPVLDLSDEQLYEFSQINRDLQIERNSQGELVIMPPTGGETGERNAELTTQLRVWSKRDGRGVSFDSSTGFRLPNGAVRAPDASWVERSRLDALSAAERKKFLPLCPEFVAELRSVTDSLNVLQEKMREYVENGAQLGWLIDAEQRRIYIYRPDLAVEILEDPATLDGGQTLPGFALDLSELW